MWIFHCSWEYQDNKLSLTAAATATATATTATYPNSQLKFYYPDR
jgi:hypothetical protein